MAISFTADLIRNEDGGWYCSACGHYRDDIFDRAILKQCPKCKTTLIESRKMVDRNYRLSVGARFCDDAEYPKWLLDLKGKIHNEKVRK